MQMKGAGIRGSKEGDGHQSPAVAMGTKISYHQSQVGHEADELRAGDATSSQLSASSEYFYI